MNRFRRRLTYANVVASLSLFLALTGGAYAAITITSEDIVDETIQSQDIAAEAVRTADIGKQAVTLDRMHDFSVNGAKVVDNTLSGADVNNGSLSGWDIANDSVTGSDLDVDVKTVEDKTRDAVWLHPHLKAATVECPAGYTAIGGGGRIGFDDDFDGYGLYEAVQLVESRPAGERGWTVMAATSHPAANDLWTLTAYARCAAL